jgi:hypothetical protein
MEMKMKVNDSKLEDKGLWNLEIPSEKEAL